MTDRSRPSHSDSASSTPLSMLLDSYTDEQVRTFWMLVEEHQGDADDWRVTFPDDDTDLLGVGVPDGDLWIIHRDGSYESRSRRP